MRGECRVRERLEAPFPPYGLSIYGLSKHFEGGVGVFLLQCTRKLFSVYWKNSYSALQ